MPAPSADCSADEAAAVSLFVGSLDISERRRQRYAALLSADEHARAGRLVLDRDRRRFVAARATLRVILGRVLAVAPESVRFMIEPGGKPALENEADAGTERPDRGIAFSLSHAADVVLVAVGRGGRIGVDIESVDPPLDTTALAQTCLTATERRLLARVAPAERHRAFLQGWTRKEAYLKGIGSGLAVPLQTVSVEPRPGVPSISDVVAAGAATAWHVHDLAVPEGYVAALALDAPRPVCACRWIDD